MPVPLTLGPVAGNASVLRSGIEWFLEDGARGEANAVIGASGLQIETPANRFEGEHLQIALALPREGIVRHQGGAQVGGFHDLVNVTRWNADEVVASLQIEDGDADESPLGALRPLYLAGRRRSELAGGHAGLLPGWHSRTRAWWGETDEAPPTLLSLGICDADGPIRGDQFAFIEMFQASDRPAHIVFVPDHPIVPFALFLHEQFTRTPAEMSAIVSDIMQALSGSHPRATAEDLLFAGALLHSLGNSPMRETFDLLTSGEVRRTGTADWVLLSLNSEQTSINRHRKLGYHLNVFKHCRRAAGPAMQAWLASAFEAVPRTLDDTRGDIRKLIAAVRGKTGARFMVLNRMSTSGLEDISCYSSFDGPLGAVLANVSSKELNLMLHDLEDSGDLTIIDVDAIAAEMGGGLHLPDGVHQSGQMQHRIRAEILRCLADMPVRRR